MKKITLASLFVILYSIVFSQQIICDFDLNPANSISFWDVDTATPFKKVVNPQKATLNTTDSCGLFMKHTYSIDYPGMSFLVNSKFNFSTLNCLHFKVKSDAGAVLEVSLRNNSYVQNWLYSISFNYITKSSSWEDVYIDLSAYKDSINYDLLVYQFDVTNPMTRNYYIDEIELISLPQIPLQIEDIFIPQPSNKVVIHIPSPIDINSVVPGDFSFSNGATISDFYLDSYSPDLLILELSKEIATDEVLDISYNGNTLRSSAGTFIQSFSDFAVNTSCRVVSIDYDNTFQSINYIDTTLAGNSYMVVANPLIDATNPSALCGRITKGAISFDYAQLSINLGLPLNYFPVVHFKILNKDIAKVGVDVFDYNNTTGYKKYYFIPKDIMSYDTWVDVYVEIPFSEESLFSTRFSVQFLNKNGQIPDTIYIDHIERVNANDIKFAVENILYNTTTQTIEIKCSENIGNQVIDPALFKVNGVDGLISSVAYDKNFIFLKTSTALVDSPVLSFTGTIYSESQKVLASFNNGAIQMYEISLFDDFESVSKIKQWSLNSSVWSDKVILTENPSPNSLNPSSYCLSAKISKEENVDYTFISEFQGLLYDSLDFSRGKIFTFDYFGPKDILVTLCLHNSKKEFPWLSCYCMQVNSTKEFEWERLSFTIEGVTDLTEFDRLVICPKVNENTICYIDNIFGPVQRQMRPNVISAKKVFPGNIIALDFDLSLQNVFPDNFRVKANGINIPVTNASIQIGNSRVLMLSLSKVINSGDIVTVEYSSAASKNVTSIFDGQLVSFAPVSVLNVEAPFMMYDNFEDIRYVEPGFWSQNFSGSSFSVVNNPAVNTSNQSAKVGKIVNSAQSTNCNISYLLHGNLDLVQNSVFSVLVYGAKGTVVHCELFNFDIPESQRYNIENKIYREYTIQADNIWELAIFDFSSESTYTDRDIINLMIIGGGKTVYVDQIQGPKIIEKSSLNDVPVYVTISTDLRGTETIWKLTDAYDETIVYAQNGPYKNTLETYSHTVFVPAETQVAFTIYDAGGNGISSRLLGYGSYEIATPCGVVRTGGAFNDVEQTVFTSTGSLEIPVNFDMIKGVSGTANKDFVKDAIQACDGGFVLVGNKNTASKSDYDIVIIHTNTKGETVWEKVIDKGLNEYATSIVSLDDQTYMLVGYVEETGAGADAWAYLCHLDYSGNIINDTVIAASEKQTSTKLFDVVTSTHNRFVACGTTNGNIFLVNGDFELADIETSVVEYPGYEQANAIAFSGNEKIIVGGFFSNEDVNHSNKKAFISVLSNINEIVSTKLLFTNSGNNVDDLVCIDTTVFVVGQNGETTFLSKFRDSGSFLWTKNLDFSNIGSITALHDNDGIVIGASSNGIAGMYTYDTEGNAILTKNYDRYQLANAEVGAITTLDGGYLVFSNILNGGTDMYLIKTNSTGCGNTPFQEQICVVTLSSTSKNLIAWERTPNKGTVSYNIYKESTTAEVYDKIGNVSYNAASGVFIDNQTDPSLSAVKYKISTVDMCNNESALSLPHRTLHLSVSPSSQFDNAFELHWDHYEGIDFSTYDISRGETKSMNVFTQIQFDPSISSYTFKAPKLNTKYYFQMSAKLKEECQSQLLKSDSGPFSQSMSNITEAEIATSLPNDASIAEYVEFGPNPASDKLFVSMKNGKQIQAVSITDFTGRVVMVRENINEQTIEIQTNTFAAGAYTITLISEQIFTLVFVKK